jgi:hypothetical protein
MSWLNMAGISVKQEDPFPTAFDVAFTASQLLKDEGYWVIDKVRSDEDLEQNIKDTAYHFNIMDDNFMRTGVFIIGTITYKSFRKAYNICRYNIDNDIIGTKRAIIFGKKFADEDTFHKIQKERSKFECPVKIRSLQHTEECCSCSIQ